jgi:phosphatidylserine decarboxylase
MFRVHKEGFRIVLISSVILVIAIFFLGNVRAIWAVGLMFLLGLVYLWIISFFRNPSRPIPEEAPELIYAPADGKVVVIENTFEPEYLKTECIQVSIFMSPLNVHVNRIPFSGKIAYSKYHKGKYLVAWHPKSSTENERQTTVVEGTHGKVLIRQIAGAMARRIISYIQPEMEVRQGQELGFIRFGSRVDLFLPLDSKVCVQMGEKVKGNQTIIAKFKQP